jgi:hypothetical protein
MPKFRNPKDGRYTATPFFINSETDAAWLAGLLEGDGSFGIYKNGVGYKYPCIQFVNTDLELLDAVAKMLGCGNRVRAKPHKEGFADMFRMTVTGIEKAPAICRKLLPYLKGRKRNIALQIVEEFS